MADHQTAAKPWPRISMELHVRQRIREYADIAYRIDHGIDGDVEVSLREGGDQRMWERVQKALGEAGWKVIPNE
jgi:hypothetical protein